MALSRAQKKTRDYLKALNGVAWNKMTREQKSHEWENLNLRNKVAERKIIANPYKQLLKE